MNFTFRPAGKYMLEAGLDDIHTLTRHWKTDLAFYHDEIRFLTDLIGRYAALLITDEHITRLKALEQRLSNAESLLNILEEKVTKHLNYVDDLIEGVVRISETTFRLEHAKLENEVMYFIDELRTVKKEIFQASEEMFKATEVKQLVNG
jgi:hypothetical protein